MQQSNDHQEPSSPSIHTDNKDKVTSTDISDTDSNRHRKKDKKHRDKDRDSRRGESRERKRHKHKHHSKTRDRSRDRDRDSRRSKSRDRKRSSKDRRSKSRDVDKAEDAESNDDNGYSDRRSKSARKDDKRRDERSRDRENSRERRRSRSSRGESRRDRSRDRDREDRRRSRDREDSRERRRRRDRDRKRSDSGDRDRRRRDRERSRDRSSRDRDRRDKERSHKSSPDRGDRRREASPDKKADDDRPSVTLKDIIAQNPGISVTEALQRLHAINATNGMGLTGPGGPGLANPQALSQATKLLREVYIGNIPPGISIPQLTDFVNKVMMEKKLCVASPFGPPVVGAWISTDGHYAFVEFRTVEDASACLNNLGGTMCGAYQLRVGRPKTNAPTGASLSALGSIPLGVGMVPGALTAIGTGSIPGISSSESSSSSSDVIMVSNLPEALEEAQVRELLEPFGEIRAFNFIKVNASVSRGGAAVLEYKNKSVTDSAIQGLNGLALGDFKLSITRVPPQMASVLLTQKKEGNGAAGSTAVSATTQQDMLRDHRPTSVLCLSNMTTVEELKDDEAYEELQEDVGDECNNYGTVRDIVIPRPGGNGGDSDTLSGVGNIFVSFTSSEGASKARNAVNGRTFNGQTVVAVFYPEKLFESKVYSIPKDYSSEAEDEVSAEMT
mmetsp:Transcript_8608/g.12845  ORF Transcript_8608/g.12845 Transcript_8608/m.12845 type:complete len:672 (+) Transcript_8608:126-2141(+)|eukprot:CAMPEP_0185028270 /NCGR_PEP_ID=MMETSP1103-20130426/13933_1 /TAXON_ID=36769 /ORGANISM="Paraphysomonas bandaiensis, Strain Caron Lab Isolate" /LENGTH=671 /DNA_ID=CAMNT_0027562645 /DNA_START=78 /DNA_END=2096 /DNA_ORIENTATION=-